MNPKDVPSITLNNGIEMPIIGLGTWRAPPDGTLYRAVRTALNCGYRLFDCALVYDNEGEVGRALSDAIEEGQVIREELFIISKVWCTYYRRDRVMKCVKKSLDNLKTTYLDQVLLHWPVCFAQVDDTLFPGGKESIIGGDVDYIEAYQGLEDCLKAGLVRSIGIANFTKAQVQRLLANTSVVPVTNQVESHLYLTQNKLREYCEDRGIVITAYAPLGHPDLNDNKKKLLLKDPVVLRLAQEYCKSSGQILLKFQTQRGVAVVPKSVNPDRIRTNIQIFDFKLSKEELKEMEGRDQCYRQNWFDIAKHLPNYPFDLSIEY